eukprot:1664308-Alexandrium_andersonii.AAC.1
MPSCGAPMLAWPWHSALWSTCTRTTFDTAVRRRALGSCSTSLAASPGSPSRLRPGRRFGAGRGGASA